MSSLSAGALSVRYRKHDDRLSHVIGIADGDAFFSLLESIEGSATDPWPASPPMQQIVEEDLGLASGPVLLGVGLSGNGHWSIAVESQPNSLLKFDVACKNSKGATWFGSRYRIAKGIQSTRTSDGLSILLEVPAAMLDGLGGTLERQVSIGVSIGRFELDASENHLAICPATDASLVMTHRWCYSMSCAR